jgi:transcriptional regulator with XRE-family HTH domain
MRSHGLTLRQVARAAGTSETNVSAYERGTKVPSQRTLGRIVAVVDAGAQSVIHTRNLMTVPATAAALRAGLRAGWRTADLLRLVREMRSNERFITDDADRAAFLAEPSTTGDPRWDAMLAGVTEEMAMRENVPVPEWTRGKALPEFWFVSEGLSLRAYAFAHSPFSLQVRGVMLDPSDLESV